MCLVGGLPEVWGESTYINAFVHDSFLELNGVVCKHLRDAKRTSFVPFELAINPISQDIRIVACFVNMGNSLRILACVIVIDTSLLLFPDTFVVWIEAYV